MNHEVGGAAAIVGGVVERCGRQRIALTRLSIDPQLAAELGLSDGKVIEHGARPTVRCELGLGRQVRFERTRTPPEPHDHAVPDVAFVQLIAICLPMRPVASSGCRFSPSPVAASNAKR